MTPFQLRLLYRNGGKNAGGICRRREIRLAPVGKTRYNVDKEVLFMGTEKERRDTQKALLYDLRLIFSTGEKENYTRQEILDLLDKIALAKDQE